jgi:hypothetical protein
MHRSGTSWLGRMLSAGGDVVNIEEPLNILNRQTILKSRVPRWYTYITEDNEEPYLRFFEDALAFRMHPLNDVRRMRFGSPRDPYRVPRRWASFGLGRLQSRRALVRDPFAVFSIPWFATRLGCHVVVIVRNPFAVVSSLKRLDYTFDFNELLQQPLLIRDHLGEFREEMESTLSSPQDVIHQGSLLWKIIYSVIDEYRCRGLPLSIVRHEDLSRAPLDAYAHLYAGLGLPFTDKAKHKIETFSSSRNPKEVSRDNPFVVRLDSRANLNNWRHRLSVEEIERIRVITEDVRGRYYAQSELGSLR